MFKNIISVCRNSICYSLMLFKLYNFFTALTASCPIFHQVAKHWFTVLNLFIVFIRKKKSLNTYFFLLKIVIKNFFIFYEQLKFAAAFPVSLLHYINICIGWTNCSRILTILKCFLGISSLLLIKFSQLNR